MREQLFILYMHTDKTAAKKLLAMVLQNLRILLIIKSLVSKIAQRIVNLVK